MEVTISKPDIDCLARGIVELAPQIRAWINERCSGEVPLWARTF